MPTLMDASDHQSLSSLHSQPLLPDVHLHQHQPQPIPETPQLQQHYQQRFPGHYHDPYPRSHLHQLPPLVDSPSTSVTLNPPSLHSTGSRAGITRGFPAKGVTVSTVERLPPRKDARKLKKLSRRSSSSSANNYSQGPKWIHRHGMINGINYHWVETTSSASTSSSNSATKRGFEGNQPVHKDSKPPLVILLHGFPQFWYTWRHQIVPLGEAGYRVVAPDLRGFNLTDKPMASNGKQENGQSQNEGGSQASSSYDIETLTKDIYDLIHHLGYEEARIVGHDWGGIIAWAFAARFSRHTSQLVVMNAPHLCRWRDVAMDFSSLSCVQQAWWTCWYTVCCQLLPSWIPESILSYHRSWILTHNMTSSPSFVSTLSCISSTTRSSFSEATSCTSSSMDISNKSHQEIKHHGVDAEHLTKVDGFLSATGGGGCAGCWKVTDMDLYRDAISQPGSIHALMEYYRNLWLSIKQMEQYGKIPNDMPILVLWGKKDRTFPRETFAQGWEEWIEPCSSDSQWTARGGSKVGDRDQSGKPAVSVKVEVLDCGHFTPEEMPAEVNWKLLDFFGDRNRQP